MPRCLGFTGRALLFRSIVAPPVFVGNNPISSLPLFLLSWVTFNLAKLCHLAPITTDRPSVCLRLSVEYAPEHM